MIRILCLALLLPLTAFAQISDELMQQQEDARLYLEMIDILKDAPIADQIAGWEKFLGDNPKSYFKEEITSNLESMKARRAASEKAREEQDSRLYFKTIEQAAALPLAEQIKLWQRFVHDNPDSLFANEARTTLNRLKEEQRWGGGDAAAPKKSPPLAANKLPPVTVLPNTPPQARAAAPTADASDTQRRDPEQALFLAAVPGLVIPGLGHFYSERYAMGGFLAAVRVSGLALIGVGAYREINQLIIPGAALALLSYAVDIFMAPIEARNYNNALEPLPPLDDDSASESSPQPAATPSLQLAWTWSF